MNDKDELIEIQGTAEDVPFSKNELDDMLELGSSAIAELIKNQNSYRFRILSSTTFS